MSSLSRTAALGTALAFGASFAYSLLEPYRLVVRRFDVAFDNLPAEVDGLRIAQLSDLHCSAITPPQLLRRAIEVCNEQHADVVVLTGDYISRRDSYSRFSGARTGARPVMDYAEAAAREVKNLRAPEGVYAVPGNHDHTNGSFEAIELMLRQANITSLVNTSTRLRGVLPLVGVDDLRAGTLDLPKAVRGVADDAAQVILSHNPRILPLLTQRNCLILSGHTHAGQVALPFTNFRMRPADMSHSPLFQGWYHEGQARLYVNSGVGSVHFPMRFRCPPELVVFTLRQATEAVFGTPEHNCDSYSHEH
jgi:predicted MPP superfamily phosphohydrolase